MLALIILAVAAGTSLGITIWAVIDLHDRLIRLERRDCQLELAERAVDRQIISGARLRITIPPFTEGLCD